MKIYNLFGNVILDVPGQTLRNADLRNVDLSNADLRNADLRNANLRGTDISNADLSNADLRNANLRGTDLSNADLRSADLRNANLRNANLSGADLRSADLRNANLRGTDLSNAALNWCIGDSPVIVSLLLPRYTVTITKDLIHIGCKTYTPLYWHGLSDDEISIMALGALTWWKKYKYIILNTHAEAFTK